MGGRDVATIQPPFSILPKKEGMNDVSVQDVVIENIPFDYRSANSGLVNVRRNSKSRRSLFVFPLPAALQNQTDLAASGLQDI
jgi:hypothetical protein